MSMIFSSPRSGRWRQRQAIADSQTAQVTRLPWLVEISLQTWEGRTGETS